MKALWRSAGRSLITEESQLKCSSGVTSLIFSTVRSVRWPLLCPMRVPVVHIITLCEKINDKTTSGLTRASVTLNSLRMYWGMLYSAIGSTTKYWYLAERSAGQYWWHFSCEHTSFTLIQARDPLRCKRFGSAVRDTHPAHLSEFGQHHYDGGVILP